MLSPLVHPGPSALVGIDDHREVVVPHFVEDRRDQAVPATFPGVVVGILATVLIRFVLVGSRLVEADHGVFHAADPTVNRDGHRIGVLESEARVDAQSVNHRLVGIVTPQGFSLVGIKGHGHRRLVTDLVPHRVSDELTRRGKGEVANVLGFEDPGLLTRGRRRLALCSLLWRHHVHRFLGGSGLLQAVALALCRRQLSRSGSHHRSRAGSTAGRVLGS